MEIKIRSEAVLSCEVEGRVYQFMLPPVAPGKEVFEVLATFMEHIKQVSEAQQQQEASADKESDEKGNDIS